MSTSYGGTPPGITGTHYGGAGLGTPGSLVPSEGEHGPGYLYAGLSLPADATKEIRGPITRWPTNGTFAPNEDSSFVYDGATDFALYQVYVDGVASTTDIGYGAGIGRIDLTVGTGLSGDVRLDDVQAAGELGGPFGVLEGSVTADDAVAGGQIAGVERPARASVRSTGARPLQLSPTRRRDQ